MTYDTKLAEFKELAGQIEYLKYTLNSLVYWDKVTYMPPEGIEYRAKVMSFLADAQHRMMSGARLNDYVDYFKKQKNCDPVTKAMVRRICRNSDYVNKIPESEYRAYIELIARAEQVWERARAENDFPAFEPYLARIFETFRHFAEYWGYEENPYDALLGYYEEGLTVKKVDRMAAQIKPFLISLLSQVREKKNAGRRKRLLLFPMPEARQREIWRLIISELGFDFNAGRVDIGAHPTVLSNSPSDVRIVNAYNEDIPRTGFFNVIHSAGKGIYQQSISRELLGTFLAEVPSFALEEGIARFYENILARSRGFWIYFYDKICAVEPRMRRFAMRQIYEDVNIAEPSLIRIEADQMTYLLHIIIRYELEREVINGKLAVKDLPAAWNRKYEDYLGICPANDREGILQDIHWAAGYVGYFPSYFVADLSAVQISAAIERECGSLDDLAAAGKFDVIREWLKTHIFRYGALYSTDELIEMSTGKALDTQDYIAYLQKRFSGVYGQNQGGKK